MYRLIDGNINAWIFKVSIQQESSKTILTRYCLGIFNIFTKINHIMSRYEKEFEEEALYLNNTISLIDKNLKKELNNVSLARKELMNVNKYMWENSVHYIDRLSDIKQDLSVIHVQMAGYE